jgi:hypothetical protein
LEHDFNTLTILAEVTIAFVAFSAIVASLKVTLGDKLTPFQSLLVHFFTESGMLAVSVALLPLVLWGFWQDELTVARCTILYALVTSGLYLSVYIRRRVRIEAPTPWPSLLVMVGWGILLPVLAVTLTEIFWQPTLAIIAAVCLWALCSGVVIFVSFLASFVDRGKSA